MSRRSTRISVRNNYSEYFDNQEDDEKAIDNDYEDLTDSGKSSKKSGTKNLSKRKSSSLTRDNEIKKPRQSKVKNNKDSCRDQKRKTIKPVKNGYNLDLNNNGNDDQDDDDSNTEDWDEVEDAEIFDLAEYKPTLPENLKIVVQKATKPKNGNWLEAYIRQQINRVRKDIQIDIHKTNLLLLIGRLKYLNCIVNDQTLKALAISVIDFKPKQNVTLHKFVDEFILWFKNNFDIKLADISGCSNIDTNQTIYDQIISSFDTKLITSPLVYIAISIIICRCFNYSVRLCYFLNPVSIKPFDLLNKNTDLKSLPLVDPVNLPSSSSTQNEAGSIDVEHNSYWIEIFDDKKNKWTCFDLINGITDDPFDIASKLKCDITYILAIDNEDIISEVTPRYASDWVSYGIKKRRVDDEWWTETLRIVKRDAFSKYEDADRKEFDEIMSKVELPKRVADFKNHPLFVLQRDILKFQAIYPPDAPTLGFFRDQPVFSRNCVHTLRSRDSWLRMARTVKFNEVPYKIVPSKFKTNKLSGSKEMLDIFGEWQTKPYEPPIAKDGIVPRNCYGNVDLYLDCMLPAGTVHLKLAGLARICAKFNIDCAPAVIGFDNNKYSRGAHPVLEGYVVCSEFKDILVDAWNEESSIINQRKKEKREKRIYDNWKRLIKGLIIRRNLKIKYGA